ncbi:hypothetical protein [Paraburkholderia atlantica]|uniref:hypothetical protein n=1 Tax=Paraburkholderia atlantica TaxID=2654982 RepID=UPI00161B12BB|nr:hypothetical protein [Paraburkholderia atlantica]MBB5414052.1 hypothetical protein [Paraburkholderia atlantica]
MKITTKVHVHAKQVQRYCADTGTFTEELGWEVYPFDMSKSFGDRVSVGEQEITIDVPDDFDMRTGLVANLEAEKKRLMAEFNARVAAIDGQIQKYLAIDAPVSEVVS